MASGNPEKAAQDGVVKQVREAIRAGRQPTIPITPDTKVTIITKNEDEAEFLTRLIMGHLGLGSEENLEVWLHGMTMYASLFGATDKAAGRQIVKVFRKQANIIERWCERD